jgi:hypothetical protein
MPDRIARAGDVWADLRKRKRSLKGPILKLRRLIES